MIKWCRDTNVQSTLPFFANIYLPFGYSAKLYQSTTINQNFVIIIGIYCVHATTNIHFMIFSHYTLKKIQTADDNFLFMGFFFSFSLSHSTLLWWTDWIFPVGRCVTVTVVLGWETISKWMEFNENYRRFPRFIIKKFWSRIDAILRSTIYLIICRPIIFKCCKHEMFI